MADALDAPLTTLFPNQSRRDRTQEAGLGQRDA
jgi:hypothetical protein